MAKITEKQWQDLDTSILLMKKLRAKNLAYKNVLSSSDEMIMPINSLVIQNEIDTLELVRDVIDSENGEVTPEAMDLLSVSKETVFSILGHYVGGVMRDVGGAVESKDIGMSGSDLDDLKHDSESPAVQSSKYLQRLFESLEVKTVSEIIDLEREQEREREIVGTVDIEEIRGAAPPKKGFE